MKFYAKRIDANQPQLVKEVREAGMTVAITSSAGEGFPDIVVGYKGINGLFEIKDPDKPPSATALTPAQEKFHGAWDGQIAKVFTSTEVIAEMRRMARERDRFLEACSEHAWPERATGDAS